MRFSIKYLEVSFFCCIFVSEIKTNKIYKYDRINKSKAQGSLKK